MQTAHNTGKIEFCKNVLRGIGILLWRPFANIGRFFRQKYTYWNLKLEQSHLFNTSLRSIASSVFVIIFVISAALLYRNGQVGIIKQTVVEKIGQWAGSAGINVQLVTLDNRKNASEAAIIAALNVKIGSPLLSFNVVEAKKRIENIGWVKEAQVQRVFPDKLNITLVERTPFAIWQIEGNHKIIDRNGVVIDNQISSRYQNLPLIVGKGADTKSLTLLSALEERPEIFGYVRALVRVGERRWDLDLKNGMRVLLPEQKPEFMLADLERMILDNDIFARGITVIDFRLNDRVRFKMDDATAEAYFEAQKIAKEEARKAAAIAAKAAKNAAQ